MPTKRDKKRGFEALERTIRERGNGAAGQPFPTVSHEAARSTHPIPEGRMTSAPAINYGLAESVALPYDDAVSAVRDALATEGFGVLTEIDVRATLKKKLDVEFRPYVILGACNPSFAHRALTAETAIGLLLPCNVVVYAGDDPGTSVVAVLDPEVQLGVTGRDDLKPMAADVKERLVRALNAVKAKENR
jgi:uncharacterized protein (DUF302 family)